ncbi:hypothetical protein EB796_023623 [Bugula neritina]|uniref:Uncharacterized protein n=1 Tax=Bugula neritina TaxID=10212 RepID=A0A7J7IVX8_BUGNE|nr:hypothetical protein EB796_023623 [Bugula neritina]
MHISGSLRCCGNIIIAAFLCLNITFLAATGAPLTAPGVSNGHYPQTVSNYKDKSFQAKLKIQNRTVECAGTTMNSYYPSPMFTCQDIT